MARSKQYKITSFEDLCNTLTPENKERMLVDCMAAFHVYIDMVEKVREMEPEHTKDMSNWEVSKFAFTWVDDGKHDFKGMVIDGPTARTSIKFKE